MSMYLRTPEAVEEAMIAHTKRDYTLGCDLGQTTDPTAIAVIERLQIPQLRVGRIPETLQYATTYRVRHLERLPLRTSYIDVLKHVSRMLCTAPLTGNCRLVIDQTGVGRPVFDLFKAAKLNPTGVTITAGDGWSRDGDSYRVAKLLLVSRLQAALHSGLLHIAAGLPEAEVLKAELSDFRANITSNGYSQFGAREGRHDDLVLAVAIGLWWRATVGNLRFEVREAVWG